MAALLRFDQVIIDGAGTLSFALEPGDMRVLQLAAKEAKSQVIELALGEQLPQLGSVLLQGVPVAAARAGSVAWVPANGGLISNLKAWENITLPLWYHSKRHQVAETEAAVAAWLAQLGLAQGEWERFMGSPAARLSPLERKLAGLLRGLLLAAPVLVVDASLLDEVDGEKQAAWIAALENHVRAAAPRALLAVAHAATPLPWTRIEQTK